MANPNMLLGIVFIPTIGAFLLPLAGYLSGRLRNILSLALVTASFLLSLWILPAVLGGQVITFSRQFSSFFTLTLTADCLAVFMALTSSFIGMVIIYYSFGYIDHYENKNEYYSMVTLFLGSMMGIVFSSNLIFLYLFWEITAICSWRLIGFFRAKVDVLRADKAFLVTFLGAIIMLVGFIII
jgi:NADH:ubiquinone oxidoreductase subunit 5 (subunit L)/multisubunit Na+/H+ antiporter MnhA subunit